MSPQEKRSKIISEYGLTPVQVCTTVIAMSNDTYVIKEDRFVFVKSGTVYSDKGPLIGYIPAMGYFKEYLVFKRVKS